MMGDFVLRGFGLTMLISSIAWVLYMVAVFSYEMADGLKAAFVLPGGAAQFIALPCALSGVAVVAGVMYAAIVDEQSR